MKILLSVSLLAMVTLAGCSTSVPSSEGSVTEAVRVNATAAVKQCGEGNVKKVTSTGFECFND